MYPTLILVLLSILSVADQKSIVIETTKSLRPVEYDCDKVIFEEENFVTCVCLDGLWAFYVSPIKGLPEWRALGGNSQCYHLGQWVTRIKRISHSPLKSSLRKLKYNSNLFMVTNDGDWGLSLPGRQLCLPSPGDNHYCLYYIKSSSPVNETNFVRGCKPLGTSLRAKRCGVFHYQDEETFEICNLNPDMKPRRPTRTFVPDSMERMGHGARRRRAEIGVDPTLDEEYLDPELLKRYTGDDQITESIADYIKSAATRMLELSRTSGSKGKDLTPVQTMLNFANKIAMVTCPVLSEDTYNIAMNSFIVQQNVRNHIKEPFVNYAAFKRIVKALERCEEDARAHDFLRGELGACRESRFESAPTISRSGFNITLPDIPRFAVASPDLHEPLVEIVWKMVLITHSYCYRYFSEYFNDHHTFTVSIMPYFSNSIQYMWFIRGGRSNNPEEIEARRYNDTEAPPLEKELVSEPKYETPWIWYGNLLGDTSQLFRNVDRCYLASRIVSDEHPSYMYPWFMNRPPRDRTTEWRRRKRETSDSSPFISGFCESNIL